MDRQRGRKAGVAAAAVERFWLVVLVGGVVAVAVVVAVLRFVESGAASQRVDAAVKAAGAVAVVVAGLLTWATLELKRAEGDLALDRDLTERYSKAVELIGSDNPRVQLGGVYAMERFILDAVAAGVSERGSDWAMGRDFLAAAAAQIQRSGPQPDGDESGEPIAAVVAAVQVLGRFNQRTGLDEDCRYDFAYLWLQRANLTGADLTKADLSRANLTEANLSGANLSEADLSGANLSEADLSGAKLTEANLSEANLLLAELSRADLEGCRFSNTTVWPALFSPPERAPE